MPAKTVSKHIRRVIILLIICITLLYISSDFILSGVGHFLIRDETPIHSDAIIVLNTGVEYYSRLIEAADLYNKGYADLIVINGNRKMDIERELEKKGFDPCCPWYEDRMRILSLYNIPRDKIIPISAEDVYDSIGEAETVGKYLKNLGLKKIIITTSKYHTKRAGFIWKQLFAGDFRIQTVSAKTDIYDPQSWWHDGRQIRWVLAEYGAWIYYFWNRITED